MDKALNSLIKIGIFIVAIPVLAALLGFTLEFLIPGCHCAELQGSCSTCGSIGKLVHILKFGGMAYGGFVLILGLPVLFILYIFLVIISLFTKSTENIPAGFSFKPSDIEKNFNDKISPNPSFKQDD